jgi:hypothetical protein
MQKEVERRKNRTTRNPKKERKNPNQKRQIRDGDKGESDKH